jgi:hypothetical protein
MNNLGKLTAPTTILSMPVVGLPAGTTATPLTNLPPRSVNTLEQTPETTTPGTTENFLSKYKMPLIIGAVAIGYFFLRKK